MTLFKTIEELVHFSYEITFSSEPFNLVIKIKKEIDGTLYEKESWLPLSDHFYEIKIIDCIKYMQESIQKESKLN